MREVILLTVSCISCYASSHRYRYTQTSLNVAEISLFFSQSAHVGVVPLAVGEQTEHN